MKTIYEILNKILEGKYAKRNYHTILYRGLFVDVLEIIMEKQGIVTIIPSYNRYTVKLNIPHKEEPILTFSVKKESELYDLTNKVYNDLNGIDIDDELEKYF